MFRNRRLRGIELSVFNMGRRRGERVLLVIRLVKINRLCELGMVKKENGIVPFCSLRRRERECLLDR